MKKYVIFLCWGTIFTTYGPNVLADTEDAVVKIYASVRFPNPTQPWVKGQAAEKFGTGVVIEGKRILTNAHVVAYGTELYVKDRRGGDKVEAKLEALNIDVDLAVLSVQDEKFFDKRPVLPRPAQLPRIQDRVTVYGFPIGGNDLSITKGEVSRIEYSNYARGVGPVIQISAPVNPGNSGGPAVVNEKMIGVVVSRVQSAQNIGTIIPNEEIDLFLKNLKRPQYDGKPIIALNFVFQNLENKALRRKLQLDPSLRGVLILSTMSPGDVDTPLKPYDVLTKIGDHDIDNTGKVMLKNGLGASYLYLVPHLAREQSLPVTIWRSGKVMNVSLPVTTRENRLVRPYRGEPLSYFIHGPLVFAPGRSDDVSLYAQMNRTFYLDNSPLVIRADEPVRFAGEELVVVSSRMFRHPINKGYADPVGRTVKDLNGIAIKNLRQLVETIRDSKDEFLTFRFVDNFSEVLVFDRKEMEKATEEILEDNGIALTRRGSPDLLKIWRASR